MQRFMSRKPFIFLLAGAVLLSVLSGAAWVLLHHESFLKRQLRQIVLRQTGRVVEVAGPLRLALGATTMLEARDVRFSSAAWDREPYMASAGLMALSLDLGSIFSAQTVVQRIELADCQVAWRINAEGASNWDLFDAAEESETIEVDPDHPPAYRLEHVQIENCQLSHATPERPRAVEIDLSKLALQLMEGGAYRVQLSGAVDEVPLVLSGNFGPVQSLWQGGPFTYEVELQAGRISLSGSGALADVRAGSGANVSLQFSGPEFATVTSYLALPPFSSDAFDFSLRLATEGEMTVVDLDGDLGSFDISAAGEVDRLVRPDKGQLRVSAAGPNLEALGELFDFQGLPADPFVITFSAKLENGQVKLEPFILSSEQDRLEISGVLGDWPSLENSSVEFSARAGEIGRWARLFERPGLQGGELAAAGHFGSDAAGLIAVQAGVEYRQSRLSIDGTLGPAFGSFQPEVDFTFDSPDLSQLAAVFDVKQLPAAPAAASGHFSKRDPGKKDPGKSHPGKSDSAYTFTDVSVALADNRARVDGRMVPTARLAGSDLNFQLDVPSAASLGRLFDADKLPDLPLVAQVRIVPDGKGLEFQVRDGSLGGISLSLQGRMADVSAPRVFSADVEIQMDSLRQLAFLAPDKQWLDLPLTASGAIAHQPGSLRFGATHLVLGQTVADLEAVVQLVDDYKGTTIRIDGQGGDLGELFPDRDMKTLPRDFSVSGLWVNGAQADTLADVRLGWGETSLELAGSVDRFWPPGRLDLKVQLRAPDASVFNESYKWALPALALSASSRIAGSPKDFTLEGLSAQLGDSSAKGELRLEWGAPPRLSGTIDAETINLNHWLAPKKDTQPAGQGRNPAKSRQVFDDSPVRGLGKKTIELDLEVRADQANLGNAVIEDIRLGILYSNEALRLDRVEARDRNGQKITGSLSLDASGPVPQLGLELKGTGIRLGLASFEGQDPSTFPLTEMELTLQGKGATRHDLVSSLDGSLRMYQGPGLVAAAGMDFMFTDFVTQLIKTLNPFSKNRQFEQLDCAVFAADIVSGKATVDPIIVRLKEVTILSQGLIDLESERIGLSFSSRTRQGLGLNPSLLINPFIKVGGTLAAPAIELDPAGGVVKGGALVATAGIPRLAQSLSDRLLGSDPCADARKKLEKADAQSH